MFAKVLLFILLTGSTLCAAADEADPTAAWMDPAADGILQQATDYLKNSKTLAVQARIEFEVFLNSGHKVVLERQTDIVIQRPNKLRAEVEGDVPTRKLFYDGKTVSIYDADKGLYTTLDVPDDIDGMADFLYRNFDVPLPLVDILVSDPYANYEAKATYSRYLGLHEVDGEPCHHLLLANAEIDYQVWILDGPEPLLRKIVIDYVNEPGTPQFRARFGDWGRDTQTADAMFEFTPPEGAYKIEILPVVIAQEGKK